MSYGSADGGGNRMALYRWTLNDFAAVTLDYSDRRPVLVSCDISSAVLNGVPTRTVIAHQTPASITTALGDSFVGVNDKLADSVIR